MFTHQPQQREPSEIPSGKYALSSEQTAPQPAAHSYTPSPNGYGHNFANISIFPPQSNAVQRKTEEQAEPTEAEAEETPEKEARSQAVEVSRSVSSPLLSSPPDTPPVKPQFAHSFADISIYPPVPVQRKENRTGLSDDLKAGVESLSGLSMGDVRVHFNSSKPAEVQALAYAQGADIHVGPGQERHLPHEAWHVVQQAQGRVQPTVQAKGVAMNDDPALEQEADVMGTRALQMSRPDHAANGAAAQPATEASKVPGNVVQRGKAKNKQGQAKIKAKKKAKSRGSKAYAGCQYSAVSPPTVKNVVFIDRPSSNSRQGQGDHIVAYALMTEAMTTSVVGKALDTAGEDLAELVTAAKDFVKVAPTNNWWHTQADGLINSLSLIDPTADEDKAKRELSARFNDVAKLLNQMPGNAVKNAKSTRGHGEGGAKGGLSYLEKQVAKGNAIKGNIWVSLLKLFDPAADPQVLNDPNKLESKISWMMALFQRAAPTVYANIEANDLTLIPDTNLTTALKGKFDPITANSIQKSIQSWIAL